MIGHWSVSDGYSILEHRVLGMMDFLEIRPSKKFKNILIPVGYKKIQKPYFNDHPVKRKVFPSFFIANRNIKKPQCSFSYTSLNSGFHQLIL